MKDDKFLSLEIHSGPSYFECTLFDDDTLPKCESSVNLSMFRTRVVQRVSGIDQSTNSLGELSECCL